MAVTYVDMKGWTVKFADDPAGIATGQDPSCQVTSIDLTPSPTTQTSDPTLCDDGTSVVTGLTWTLNVEWYADLSDPAGFSWYISDNLLEWKAFELTMGADGGKYAGEAQIVPGAIGGARSAGFVKSTAPMPARNIVGTKPTVTAAATVATPAPSDAVG